VHLAVFKFLKTDFRFEISMFLGQVPNFYVKRNISIFRSLWLIMGGFGNRYYRGFGKFLVDRPTVWDFKT